MTAHFVVFILLSAQSKNLVSKLMKAQKRKKILDIATKLFAEKNFENTTTRDISKAAGVSNAALYYYFHSKESLLFEILNQTLTAGLDFIKETYQSDRDLKEKLTAITSLYTQYYADAQGIDKMKLLVHDQKSLSKEHKEEINKIQRDYLNIMVSILGELKAQGEMVALDTTVCSFAFFGMVHWAYRWYNPEGKIKPEQLSEIFNRVFSKGIYSASSSSQEQ